MNRLMIVRLIPIFVACVFSMPLAAKERLAVFPDASPDPTAIEAHDGSGFYAFTTGKGVTIWHSRDLLQWKRIGCVFEENVPAWALEKIEKATSLWAPDVVFVDGLYYVYYSVSALGSPQSAIGLAVNKTLDPGSADYRWTDRGIVLESDPKVVGYNAIDPDLFIDRDGKGYLTWGSYWTGIKGLAIDPKTGKPFLYRDLDLKIPADYIPVACRTTRNDSSLEGPHIFRRGDWYYLFVSWGRTNQGLKSTYRVMIGRSKSPLGPFFDKDGKRMDDGGGTLLIESSERWKGPGHGDFFQSSPRNGGKAMDWLIIHAEDTEEIKAGIEKKRVAQVRPLFWDKNDWPIVGDILSVPIDEFDPKKFAPPGVNE